MLDEAFVRSLLAEHPAYSPEHVVFVLERDNLTYVGWHATESVRNMRDGSYLDLQLDHLHCYILGIGLEPRWRGLGLGEKLYRIAERIGEHFGCGIAAMQASGKTYSGELRVYYVERKLGYRIFGMTAHKALKPTDEAVKALAKKYGRTT